MRIKLTRLIYLLSILAWISPGPWIGFSQANPLQGSYLCMPKVKPNQDDLNFEIHSLPCGTDEQLMKVMTRRGGIIELYPSEPPPSAEENQDLESYKKFHGVQR